MSISTVIDAVRTVEGSFNTFTESYKAKADELQDRIEVLESRQNAPKMSGGSDKGRLYDAFGRHLKALHAGSDSAASATMAELYGIDGKAMSGATAGAGGNLVPEILAAEIERKLRASSPLYEDAKRTRIDGSPGSYKRIVSNADQAGGWVGENGTRSETNTATFNKVAFPDGMVYARPKCSEELVHGSAYNVAEFVVDEAARTFSSLINQAIIDGDASNKPRGFLNTAPVTTADGSRTFGTLQYFPTGAAGAFQNDYRAGTPGDPGAVFYNTVYSLKPEYRQVARWYMSGVTLAAVAKLRDADGRSLLTPQMSSGVGPLLLGYEVRQADHMPAIGANSHSIAFGSLADAYEIVEGFGLKVTVDDNLTVPGQVSWYLRRYLSGSIICDDALRVIKFAST
jgi:HK97 family phage major capsid protein